MVKEQMLAKFSAQVLANSIKPEVELLLCCARTRPDTQRADKIKALLSNDIDWTYLVELARKHGVMPLLYWNLHTVCPQAVPGATLELLKSFFQDNVRRNLFLSGELIKLLKLLEMEGIPAIPFKGPVLAASVYGSLALRSFWDLDLLVHKRDVLQVKSILLARGYRPEHKLSALGEVVHLQLDCEYNFDRNYDNLHLEIHWRIVSGYIRFQLDPEGLWERHVLLPFAGTTVRSLSPEDQLLILCLHNGAKHHWQRLSMICDLAELIRSHQGMDWEWVLEQAAGLNIRRIIFLGLLMAGDLTGARLPPEVLKRAQQDPEVESLKARIREELFTEVEDPAKNLKNCITYFRMRERLSDRLRYLSHIMSEVTTPSEKEEELLLVPAFLYFLYYIIRPIRLVLKYIGIFVSRGSEK